MIGLEFKEASVIEEAYAKINLFLEVFGKREDGYHGIRSVMQTVSLHDTVNVRLSESGISMTCSTPALDCGASNLCIKAAKAFSSACGGVGAEITLTKVIPMQAGLGGGSADAAAVLRAMNFLCGCPFSVRELYRIGAKVGADVPFCVSGGTALAEGIGEILTPLPALPHCRVVICAGMPPVSTPEAYGRLDRLPPPSGDPYPPFAAALESGTLADIGKRLCNRFEDAFPQSAVRGFMIQSGAYGALLSGSGSAVFGLFPETPAAEKARAVLERSGYTAFLCRPVSGSEVCRNQKKQ